MNKLVSFIFGLVVGGAAGAITTKIICDKTMKKDLDEAKKSFRDYIRKNTVVEVKEAETPTVEKKSADPVQNLIKNYVSTQEQPDAKGEKKEESPQDDPAEFPIRISRQKFVGAKDGTEKAYLTYYEDDDILADDDEDLYDPAVLMGAKLHEWLVENAPNPTDAIYIHDEKLKIMYEISIIHDSYESVTGEELTEKVINKKRKK